MLQEKNQYITLLLFIPIIFFTSPYTTILYLILFSLLSLALMAYGIISYIKIIKISKSSSYTANTLISGRTEKEILKSWLMPLLAVIGGSLSAIIALIIFLSLKL